MRYKSNILTISADGSVRKRFGDFVHFDSNYKPVDPATNVVQRMDLAVSSKRFGNRRNIVYATSGINWSVGDPDGIYGFQTINSVGTEDSASITSPSNYYWHKVDRQLWGNRKPDSKGL